MTFSNTVARIVAKYWLSTQSSNIFFIHRIEILKEKNVCVQKDWYQTRKPAEEWSEPSAILQTISTKAVIKENKTSSTY